MKGFRLPRVLAGKAARSRLLARLIFGIDFPPVEGGERYFDLTTPVLVHVLRRRLTRTSRLLDMGTGAFASIGLACWRRTGCEVVSTDIHPRIVERARANVARNQAPVRVLETRFFEGIDGAFDAVSFNIPYVPTELLSSPDDFQSDGGPEGTTVIEGFLDAFGAAGGEATAYLGVNAILVPRAKVDPLVAARPDLVHEGVLRWGFLPVDVHVIRRRPALDARAS